MRWLGHSLVGVTVATGTEPRLPVSVLDRYQPPSFSRTVSRSPPSVSSARTLWALIHLAVPGVTPNLKKGCMGPTSMAVFSRVPERSYIPSAFLLEGYARTCNESKWIGIAAYLVLSPEDRRIEKMHRLSVSHRAGVSGQARDGFDTRLFSGST